jgi:hypothetical protein
MKKIGIVLVLAILFIGSAYALDTVVVADSSTGVASRTSSVTLTAVTATSVTGTTVTGTTVTGNVVNCVTANFDVWAPVITPAAIGDALPTADKRVTVNIDGTNYHMLLRSI